MSRLCSRPACKQPALYTLTYVYRDSTAVLGPLATYVEPHCYDLCAAHAGRLTAPRGWDVVRLPVDPADPDRSRWRDLLHGELDPSERGLPAGLKPRYRLQNEIVEAFRPGAVQGHVRWR